MNQPGRCPIGWTVGSKEQVEGRELLIRDGGADIDGLFRGRVGSDHGRTSVYGRSRGVGQSEGRHGRLPLSGDWFHASLTVTEIEISLVGVAVELLDERVESGEGRVDGGDGLWLSVGHLSADDVDELFPSAE